MIEPNSYALQMRIASILEGDNQCIVLTGLSKQIVIQLFEALTDHTIWRIVATVQYCSIIMLLSWIG